MTDRRRVERTLFGAEAGEVGGHSFGSRGRSCSCVRRAVHGECGGRQSAEALIAAEEFVLAGADRLPGERIREDRPPRVAASSRRSGCTGGRRVSLRRTRRARRAASWPHYRTRHCHSRALQRWMARTNCAPQGRGCAPDAQKGCRCRRC